MGADSGSRASPYSKGGGGVRLEHLYGATLLASLLTGDPVHELGDGAVPVSVRFQASAESPVDDFLVTGETTDGGQRRVSIGARRNPLFTGGDRATAELLKSYVEIVTGEWDEVRTGRWRLALVTGSRSMATPEVRDLAEIAKTQRGEREFRAEVHRRGKPLQSRLTHVDALVAQAARKAGASEPGLAELTWRLLSCLWVQETRLEDSDRRDRYHAVARLRTVARGGTAESAEALFRRLDDLAARYDISAGDITLEILRRDLSGFPLAASPAPCPASPVAVILAPPARDQAPGAAGLVAPSWEAGQECRAGGRDYLLWEDKDGLLRDGPGPGGQGIRRQALARQTSPPPATGRRYVWLRQGGQELRRECDLLGRVLPGRLIACDTGDAATGNAGGGSPGERGTVTLALSWPVDRHSGLPSPTARTWCPPGALDTWRLSILLRGLRDLMVTLERLHHLGKAHRELAPRTVIVDGDGTFVLRDLGLAATDYRRGEGTDEYQAPEQGFGSRGSQAGPATDVYRAAAIAWHLITGRLPVPGIAPPPVRHRDLSAAASAVIGAALAVRPEDRPGPDEFGEALRR